MIIDKENRMPSFISKAVSLKRTSLGDNPCIPPETDDYFESKILKKEFIFLSKEVSSKIGEECLSIHSAEKELSKLISKCIKIEYPFKKELEKICINYVSSVFEIPDDTISISCSLVGKVRPNKPMRITPEEKEGNEYDFDDIEEMEYSSKEILKRRFINSLIQGACVSYSRIGKEFIDDIYDLNYELPMIYKKIWILNDYISFIKNIKMKDGETNQGSIVEVILGVTGDRTVINSQAIIFPYLLDETVRGLFELFSSSSLPEDSKSAKYIISHSDFLLAEPWDKRLGLGLWKRIIEDKKIPSSIVPYFFFNLCSLKVDKFNKIVKNMLAGTSNGKNILNKLILKSKRDKINDSNIGKMSANHEKMLISDNGIEFFDKKSIYDSIEKKARRDFK